MRCSLITVLCWALYPIGPVRTQSLELVYDEFLVPTATATSFLNDSNEHFSEVRPFVSTSFSYDLVARGSYRGRDVDLGRWTAASTINVPLNIARGHIGYVRFDFRNYVLNNRASGLEEPGFARWNVDYRTYGLSFRRRLIPEIELLVSGQLFSTQERHWINAGGGVIVRKYQNELEVGFTNGASSDRMQFYYQDDNVLAPHRSRGQSWSGALRTYWTQPLVTELWLNYRTNRPWVLYQEDYSARSSGQATQYGVRLIYDNGHWEMGFKAMRLESSQVLRLENLDQQFGKIDLPDGSYDSYTMMFGGSEKKRFRVVGELRYQTAQGHAGTVIESWPFTDTWKDLLGATYVANGDGRFSCGDSGPWPGRTPIDFFPPAGFQVHPRQCPGSLQRPPERCVL